MHEIVPSVGIVVFNGREVLLVRKKNHPKQQFQLPGGAIEDGETIAEASVRELFETTTLKTTPSDLVILPNEWSATITKEYGTKVFPFKCAVCRSYSGTAMETASAVPEWVDIEKLKNRELVPNVFDAIRVARELDAN